MLPSPPIRLLPRQIHLCWGLCNARSNPGAFATLPCMQAWRWILTQPKPWQPRQPPSGSCPRCGLLPHHPAAATDCQRIHCCYTIRCCHTGPHGSTASPHSCRRVINVPFLKLWHCLSPLPPCTLSVTSCRLLLQGRLQMELSSLLGYGAAEASLALMWRLGILDMLLPQHALYLKVGWEAAAVGGPGAEMALSCSLRHRCCRCSILPGAAINLVLRCSLPAVNVVCNAPHHALLVAPCLPAAPPRAAGAAGQPLPPPQAGPAV